MSDGSDAELEACSEPLGEYSEVPSLEEIFNEVCEEAGSNEPPEDTTTQCPVELVLTLQRIEEWSKKPESQNANAQQGGTISEFSLTSSCEDEPLVTGFALEAAGPSSKTSQSDQRILAGTYYLIDNPGTKGPYRLVQKTSELAEDMFGERSLVNIHSGNYPTDLEGCICPGPNWQENGVVTVGGVQNKDNAYPSVTASSVQKLGAITSKIGELGLKESRTTYDGNREYSGSSYYKNVAVIIRDIPTVYVYFSIYYDVGDDAFKRASDTWARDVDAGADKHILESIKVKTVEEFKAAWDRLYDIGNGPYHKVREGRIFSHASKGSRVDGLEFFDADEEDEEDGTLGGDEILSLPVLNWEKEGRIVLHGCNTGLAGARGGSPARAMAAQQSVRVLGQSGFAYFSISKDRYEAINRESADVYLWAFSRGRNSLLGNGAAMAPVEVVP